ncbi:sugar diacid utilization regulator SdaR [Klebsiella pneumoniae subsp. ozaenae]|uniref:Sugar diacid utilization regulator SdaR n=1 Tax=Klebsiella pneumoniae subsp. ozaenae TaxID=574 RepID=A0A377ZMI7_KLEPO|nr:sugar diacid utilization regulator SdaR [Klebsiella pneumoniae subsp. ozaenae]
MLLDTLSSFIANNAEPGKTSLLLGIHRNTLTYRLQQIKKHIQLDPMVFTDLTQLAGVGTLLSPAESAPERMD